jgi:N-acetylglucosamine-6-phosphate deacetylase
LKKGLKGKTWINGGFKEKVLFIEKDKIIFDKTGEFEKVGYIIPPFADGHIHGGWGYSFQKGDFEVLERKLIENGIFFAIPTLMNDTLENLKIISNKFQKYKERKPESIFPFLRVEGPFISKEKSGAQNVFISVEPTKENIDKFIDIENIKMFTFAPEIENAEYLVKESIKKGKIPSIGHSKGSFSDFKKVKNLGVKHFTHFPNALSGLHHREIGLVGAALYYDDLYIEIIGDMIHSSEKFLKLVYKIKKGSFSIVSDLIPPHKSNQKESDGKKIIRSGRKITDERGILLGGDTLLPEQFRLLFNIGFSLDDLISMGCINNRKFFDFEEPSLDKGSKASFIVLNDDMQIKYIFYKGKEICSL